jgi:hypothetical protein
MPSKPKSVRSKSLPVPVAEEPKSIRLTIDLTKTEAEDILRLCQHIGGTPDETRGIFDQITEAIEERGINLPPRGVCLIEEKRGSRVSGLNFTYYRDRDKLMREALTEIATGEDDEA